MHEGHLDIPTKPSILLVEDNIADQRLFRHAVEHAGWDVHVQVLPDGAVALQYLHKRGAYVAAPTPKVIVLDLNMPRMDGLTLLAAIKASSNLQSIPVVILTTSRAPSDLEAASAADRYLYKEWDIGEYYEAIRTALCFWLDPLAPNSATNAAPIAPTGK